MSRRLTKNDDPLPDDDGFWDDLPVDDFRLETAKEGDVFFGPPSAQLFHWGPLHSSSSSPRAVEQQQEQEQLLIPPAPDTPPPDVPSRTPDELTRATQQREAPRSPAVLRGTRTASTKLCIIKSLKRNSKTGNHA
jgi:hypothetical protein